MPSHDSPAPPPPDDEPRRAAPIRPRNRWEAVWEQLGAQLQAAIGAFAERSPPDDRFDISISMAGKQLQISMGWKHDEPEEPNTVTATPRDPAFEQRRARALALIDGEQRADGDSPTAEALLDELLAVDPRESSLSRRLEAAVEDALKNYHKLGKLEQNALARFFLPFEEGARDPFAAAKALRHALDEAIERLSAPDESPPTGAGPNPAEYLDLRYRQGLLHKEIAARWGYTERHLLRLRRELIEAVALFFERIAKDE